MGVRVRGRTSFPYVNAYTMTLKRSLCLGLLVVFLGIAFLLVLPDQTLAQSATTMISEGLNTAAGDTYSTDLTVSVFVGNMIRTLLAATGIVFLILTVYAGILYMTAQGDD